MLVSYNFPCDLYVYIHRATRSDIFVHASTNAVISFYKVFLT